jgi:hypothetical protein
MQYGHWSTWAPKCVFTEQHEQGEDFQTQPESRRRDHPSSNNQAAHRLPYFSSVLCASFSSHLWLSQLHIWQLSSPKDCQHLEEKDQAYLIRAITLIPNNLQNLNKICEFTMKFKSQLKVQGCPVHWGWYGREEWEVWKKQEFEFRWMWQSKVGNVYPRTPTP